MLFLKNSAAVCSPYGLYQIFQNSEDIRFFRSEFLKQTQKWKMLFIEKNEFLSDQLFYTHHEMSSYFLPIRQACNRFPYICCNSQKSRICIDAYYDGPLLRGYLLVLLFMYSRPCERKFLPFPKRYMHQVFHTQARSHYIEVAQGGVSSRAIHN